LLLKGKKIAGILIENTWKNQQLHASIIGIGINLNTQQFPENLQHRAASLWLETGLRLLPDAFLLAYSAHFLSRKMFVDRGASARGLSMVLSVSSSR
jgi:BirA family biotin operon repressor/biotin-[acetyl-CoA-carboxylase] ligase